MRVNVTGAAVLLLLLAGCGGSGETKKTADEGASETLIDCATDTFRLRREINLMLDIAKDGIDTSTYVAISEGIGDERDAAKDCPADIPTDMGDVLTAVADLGGAVTDYFECRSKSCEATAIDDLTSASHAASYSLRRVERELTDDALDAAAASVKETSLEKARNACLADESVDSAVQYLTIGDQGESLALQLGGGSVSEEIAASGCVLDQLNTPDSTRNLIDATTSLMGRQTDTWDDYEMSWSYHPDSGLNAVIEMVES